MVIGSGYGGGIAACRASRAGQAVCVLERGKEWRPGDFPESFWASSQQVSIKQEGEQSSGDGLELFNFNICEEVTVLTGNGIGGTSLINANVGLEAEKQVRE